MTSHARGGPVLLDALTTSPAVFGLASVTEAEQALEHAGHGLFTRTLCDVLQGAGGMGGGEGGA